ncbi:GxxExxY protein [Pseudoalteromonas sp. S3776]|uniref:GxxExxY protein n=1 Tax=unclassified Pseudoalteromonas TaxID=194690 RepID=UPI0011098E8D|nr:MULTISPECIES: GxxExxY protein [unclassified Pseudoalteromonas]MDC9511368.1 GxxExxY protein [Pseudoalteromonas sp. Angola-4]TMO75866.1 GxxExxY protein [Pseudoalteromonas sp. S3785]TMO76235.1 GxxExxY protein [Pseudoalteromonas sp. S3776]
MDINKLTHAVIGCAIEVHKTLGPGLLESTYEACLIYELSELGLTSKSQHDLPVYYKDTHINAGYRLDILLPNKLIIELKSVEKLLPIHSAQLITYMKLANVSAGLLINFNTIKLIDGIKRFNF